MIEQTVQELTPIVGTRPACRALGASPATIYRRRRPPEPRPRRPRAAPARALSEPEREAVLAELHSRAVRRLLARAGLGDPAGRGPLPGFGAHDVPAACRTHGEVRERRDQRTHPAYAKPELLAERPNELWSWDIFEVEGSGEVDVLLPVRDPRRVQPLRRRLDRPAPRGRTARQGADPPSLRAAADHARAADRARRPRQLDDQQARRVPPRRPRRDHARTTGPTPRPTTPTPRRTSRR